MLFFINVKAQPAKEAWHWYFGRYSSLDFSSGIPVPSQSNGGNTAEGSASISDAVTGQFLFGAMGVFAFNKNESTMNNGLGLLGHSSTTQSDLIVPKPGSSNIFYIVTADYGHPLNRGVHYSIVDLNLQNGLGAITVKNKILTPPPCTEKLVGARHCNGIDYWILTHPLNSNAINAYLVTSSGIDTVPVVSHIGTIHQLLSNYYAEAVGYMKVSPDSKKLALGISSDSLPILELFDFDNSSGIVTNVITKNYLNFSSGPYGLTFSPDNSKLYVNVSHGDSASAIYQYDLSSGIPSVILSSQTLISQVELYTVGLNHYANQFGAMQMAPDGKIYVSRSGDTLSAINNPNSLGLACNFQLYALPIVPVYNSYSFGLPNFIDANYAGIQIDIPDKKQCGAFNPDTLDAGPGFASYYWSTGASSQTIVINNPGTYWITVTNGQGCSRTDTVHAYLITPGKKIVSACVADTLNTSQSIVLSYSWSDGTTNPVKTFTNSGIFWEDVSFVGGCTVRDSFIINIDPNPAVNLGVDTSFCKGNLRLNAYYPSSTYLWNTTETGPIITANKPGIYFVTVTTQAGCNHSDTLVVKADPEAFNFKMPNVVTPNNDNINDAIDFGSLQFSALQIQIYNRWGQIVFESSDPEAIWKPTNNDGTYFYTANYRIDCGLDSETKSMKGFITVVR